MEFHADMEKIGNTRKYIDLQIAAYYTEAGNDDTVEMLNNLKGLLDGSLELHETTETHGMSTVITFSVVPRDPNKPTPRGGRGPTWNGPDGPPVSMGKPTPRGGGAEGQFGRGTAESFQDK